MSKVSLTLAEFINPEVLDEAMARDLSTPQNIEKATFDSFYELLYNASVFAFSLTPQQTQVINREQASAAYNKYHESFLQFEQAFSNLAKQNPEQMIKYTMIINLLHQNKMEFEKAIRMGTMFTPVYSNNPQSNQTIAREKASGSATFNAKAINNPAPLTRGSEPLSKINAIKSNPSWANNTKISLNRT